jgi:hypothetical protein
MKIKIDESTYKRVMGKLLSEDGIDIDISSGIQLLENTDTEEDELEVMKRKLTSDAPIEASNKPKFQTLSQFAGDGWIEKYLDEPTTDIRENDLE